MTYAVVSDIHGNMPALEAILADMEGRQVDAVLLLGDYVFDFPGPNAVVDRLRALPNTYAIGGNKEDYFRYLAEGTRPMDERDQFAALYWQYRALTEENRAYLCRLPVKMALCVHGWDLYLAHQPGQLFGTGAVDMISCDTYPDLLALEPNLTHADYLTYARKFLEGDAAFRQKLAELPDGVYLFGHFHTQWYAEVDGKLLINPGSAGLPMDNDSRAPYTLLELTAGAWSVEERRVPYDTEGLIADLRASALYKAAELWCEANVLHLRTGRIWTSELFRLCRQVAEELGEEAGPFSDRVWNMAGQRWFRLHPWPRRE